MSEPGLILVSHGNRGVAEYVNGDRVDCQYRRSVGRPYCGDRVTIENIDEQSLVVTAIEPRDNVFTRANDRGKKQVIAANLDQVLIVIAPAPAPSRDLMERYLVAVHSLGIRPVIVLNKAELMADVSPGSENALGRLDAYRQLGYETVTTSCKTAPGVEKLFDILEQKTSILVGQSGVGKSSLINSLLPDHDLQTGELSRVTGKGTHTTTTTMMYSLPCTGRLIDSPGVWEYGLWDMQESELAAGFPEFREFLGQCRFNDCRHSTEPDCAIKNAASREDIAGWRYSSYLRLLEQMA